jgi:argininosuccinate synthase
MKNNKISIKKPKVILAYSGGLDTSVILHWLAQKGFEVICFIANVGQQESFEEIKEKALKTGASKVYVENLIKEFVEDYAFKALKAQAIYEGSYLLGTSLTRPLIAKKQVEIAQKEGTVFLSHGATGKGNDQVRFELTYAALMPQSKVIAPWKEDDFLALFKGRADLLAYAHKHGITVTSTLEKPYSIDENIMHTSYESGLLEDANVQPPADMFKKTLSPEQAPDKTTTITITFQSGVPQSVYDHETKKTVSGSTELFEHLNMLGSKNAIGRVDMVENRLVGIKSRGVYETPAGTILMKAHKTLESITLDKEVTHLKEHFSLMIAGLIYNGFWESPEMQFLMAAIEQSQHKVTGAVILQLYKGNITIIGRSSPFSLYNTALASMNEIGGYDQKDAKGFIALHTLRLKLGGL